MASLSLSTLTSAVLISALRQGPLLLLTQVFPNNTSNSPWIDRDNFDSDDILLTEDEAVPRQAVHLDCDGLVGLSDQPELPHLAGAVLGVGAVSLKMNIVAWAELTPDITADT